MGSTQDPRGTTGVSTYKNVVDRSTAALAAILAVFMAFGAGVRSRWSYFLGLLRSDLTADEIALELTPTSWLHGGGTDRAQASLGGDAIIAGVKIVAIALVGSIIVAYLYDELATLQILNDTGLNSSIDQLIVFFGLGILFSGILILVLVSRKVLMGIDRF